ncbi:CgeB family protein [Aquibium microcysteis]|uniref:CgeB family protein n=1 Tax=Aquibium microcysteis TaxID=675281 RepID=UPI00165D2DF3|nr:glycosyltransferase [Aquibium microcysteis]
MLKPDVFLTIKGAGVDIATLRKLRKIRVPTVMFYPDVSFDHPQVSINSFNEYDLFVTTKSFQIDYLSDLLGADRVAYVPHGYVDGTHAPLFESADVRQSFDVFYAGNHSAEKQVWLERLAKGVPDASIGIVGNRWDQTAGGPLRKATFLGEQLAVAYAQSIQKACINVAVHFGAAPNGWADLVSTRTFEIPACKGFMLHIDNPEVREFFDVGTEIDTFATAEELCDKVRFYLDRPELRAAMIERAYARCVPAYGCAARARRIDELLHQTGLAPSGAVGRKAEERYHASDQ